MCVCAGVSGCGEGVETSLHPYSSGCFLGSADVGKIGARLEGKVSDSVCGKIAFG